VCVWIQNERWLSCRNPLIFFKSTFWCECSKHTSQGYNFSPHNGFFFFTNLCRANFLCAHSCCALLLFILISQPHIRTYTHNVIHRFHFSYEKVTFFILLLPSHKKRAAYRIFVPYAHPEPSRNRECWNQC
jgi:hypothetical protein